MAAAAIRRAEQEADDQLIRARLLGPYVEIVLAAGDMDGAQSAAGALEAIAAELRQPYLDARTRVQIALACRALGDATALTWSSTPPGRRSRRWAPFPTRRPSPPWRPVPSCAPAA